jgi:hypothetical protein
MVIWRLDWVKFGVGESALGCGLDGDGFVKILSWGPPSCMGAYAYSCTYMNKCMANEYLTVFAPTASYLLDTCRHVQLVSELGVT